MCTDALDSIYPEGAAAEGLAAKLRTRRQRIAQFAKPEVRGWQNIGSYDESSRQFQAATYYR